MNCVIFLKGLMASVTNINSILTLNPLPHDSNIAGYIIIIMILAIVTLIGYTLFSNGKK